MVASKDKDIETYTGVLIPLSLSVNLEIYIFLYRRTPFFDERFFVVLLVVERRTPCFFMLFDFLERLVIRPEAADLEFVFFLPVTLTIVKKKIKVAVDEFMDI